MNEQQLCGSSRLTAGEKQNQGVSFSILWRKHEVGKAVHTNAVEGRRELRDSGGVSVAQTKRVELGDRVTTSLGERRRSHEMHQYMECTFVRESESITSIKESARYSVN